MITLSVNVNKVATLRNARGGEVPSITQAVRCCVEQGVRSITVHPRQDQRHIRPDDVATIGALLKGLGPSVEFNIEGDPRPDWIDMVAQLVPTQATLVPVLPGEITSQAGWPPEVRASQLAAHIRRFSDLGIRSSVFVNPSVAAVQWAHECGADRVELFTEPFARGFATNQDLSSLLAPYVQAGQEATRLGMAINAGHDLDSKNLAAFCQIRAQGCDLREVSIGHALISEALFDGLAAVCRRYLDICRSASAGQ